MSDGWRCPGCGKCYSPYIQECTQCGKYGTWVTYYCAACGRYHGQNGVCVTSTPDVGVKKIRTSSIL